MSVGRASSQVVGGVTSLSGVDHDILSLLHVHRVLTTPQLVALTGRPERTVDYRLARLRERSLAARTRPYAASGSAPYYWWLTRAGARLVEGTSPAPGKGEPNPLFLRHTAAIAGLYVALREVGPDAGLKLASWRRDEESWEDWDHHGRVGCIRPDVYAEVQLEVDGEPGTTGVFIEVDFATMDQARLRAKVARHRRYAAETVWWERHPCCPALLLVTISEARVSRFLAGVEKDRPRRDPYEKDHPVRYDELVAARAAVTSPEAAIAAPVWRQGVGDAPCTLSALLVPEVRQYRQVIARVKAAWCAEDDALRRSAAWDLSRDADAIASARGDTEAAGGLRYLLRQRSSGHGDWVDEHPDLVDATLSWWSDAKKNGALAPMSLVAAWRSVGQACWLEQVERLFAQHETSHSVTRSFAGPQKHSLQESSSRSTSWSERNRSTGGQQSQPLWPSTSGAGRSRSSPRSRPSRSTGASSPAGSSLKPRTTPGTCVPARAVGCPATTTRTRPSRATTACAVDAVAERSYRWWSVQSFPLSSMTRSPGLPAGASDFGVCDDGPVIHAAAPRHLRCSGTTPPSARSLPASRCGRPAC